MDEQEQQNYALGVNAFMPENAVQEAPLEDDGGYSGKPEFYDYSAFKLPENYSYDEGLLNEFNDLASKCNLSQKGADEIMALAVKLAELTGGRFSDAAMQERRLKTEGWRRALMTDREIGGANLNRTMAAANTAYSHFAGPEVQMLLQESGLNCHPEIVKMFCRIGRLMHNDKVSGADIAAPQKESREDILFPTMA